ncbi:MAG: hypothetical protein EG824_01915 [Deltaproteobacteria bacterium]|nr:hypothetical protein [Deltaproteobacteria bacterium]
MAEENKSAAKTAETKLVRMVRTPEMAKGGPVVADVHPDEVANYALGGWVIEQAATAEEDKGKK